MQKHIKKITFILLSSLLLSGCGGGSGGGSTASQAPSTASSSTTQQKVTTSVTTPTSSSYSSTAGRTGSIVDASGVEGLTIKCGSQESQSVADGFFNCSSFPISIYIGEFKLGEVAELPVDRTIYTQDMLNIARGATTHPNVTKISMLLQSLDSDGDIANGINLARGTLSLVSSHLVAYSKIEDISFEDLEYIIEDIVRERQALNYDLSAVDMSTAQNNLTTMTAQTPALTYEQRSIGRIR